MNHCRHQVYEGLSVDNYKTLIAALLASEANGTPQHELIVEMGATPILLRQHQFPDLPMIIKGKTVGKIHFDHGIPRSTIERLPDLLQVPKAIYKSAAHPDASVLMTFETKGAAGIPIIIAIHKGKRIGRSLIANEVASVYAKEGPDPAVKWKADGLLLWEAQTKSP